jgi:predicted MFS family arabinose efflux permease
VAREVAANGRFWGLSAIGAMTQGGHFAVLVLVPLLLTRYHGMTTFKIGMTLLPGAIAIGAFGMAGGALLNRLGTRRLLLSGTGTMLGAAALFHVAAPGWQPWAISLLYIAPAATG